MRQSALSATAFFASGRMAPWKDDVSRPYCASY